jgi:signal transduction histidine kinase
VASRNGTAPRDRGAKGSKRDPVTPARRLSRRARAVAPELLWAAFAAFNLLIMIKLSAWKTVPFHFIWLSVSILYGFRMWRPKTTVAVLLVVMVSTGYALIVPVFREHEALSALDESTEVPLMAAIFLAMVWHARRRQSAMRETERALAQERDAVERLRVLDELKNTFLAAVSHDMRTPLTAILGSAVTLERAEELGLSEAERTDLAGRTASNARKLTQLLTDLLDLDRLNRGVVGPLRQPTDVGSLALELVETFEMPTDRTLRRDVDHVVVSVDAAKVQRIVENLLANSVRHTPPGADVWLKVKPIAGGVLIAIEDSGPGVPESLRQSIFEPFSQGPQLNDASPGVGIGLSLVSRFAALHGGQAWVEDRPGGGASFRVFLPDAPSDQAEDVPSSSGRPTVTV